MQRRTKLSTAVGGAVLIALPLTGIAFAGNGKGQEPDRHTDGPPSVLIDAPSLVRVSSPLPCTASGFSAGLVNTTGESTFADLDLNVQSPLTLSRRIFSTHLPAVDPDHTVSTDVEVRMPRDTAPGYYRATLSVDGHDSRDVWLEVGPAPERKPGDNLALGEQAYASSTHANVRVCGGVDGNTDSAQWGASGTHDATAGVFPDTYGVNLATTTTVGRVELYTLDSQRYPAAEMGLRDFDIQVHTTEGWRTVEEVRGNEVGHITATFEPVRADRVQVVSHDSNDHKYSRIVELEVYAS